MEDSSMGRRNFTAKQKAEVVLSVLTKPDLFDAGLGRCDGIQGRDCPPQVLPAFEEARAALDEVLAAVFS